MIETFQVRNLHKDGFLIYSILYFRSCLHGGRVILLGGLSSLHVNRALVNILYILRM